MKGGKHRGREDKDRGGKNLRERREGGRGKK